MSGRFYNANEIVVAIWALVFMFCLSITAAYHLGGTSKVCPKEMLSDE